MKETERKVLLMKKFEKTSRNVEFYALCHEVCDDKNANAIFWACVRADIESIDDFMTFDWTKAYRVKGIGETRLEFIKEMILFVEDEEKIQHMLETNVILRKFYDDDFQKRVIELEDGIYSPVKIARVLNIDESFARVIRRWA